MGYNFGFDMCEFIMQGSYPEAGKVIGPLIHRNAMHKEIVNYIRRR